MDINKLINEKKTLIIEILIVIGVIVGGYFGYTSFFGNEPTVTTQMLDQSLLGANFIQYIQATNNSKITFKNRTFLTSEYVRQLQDFSEIISPNATRGRLDPFLPYASTRPLH